MISWDKYYYDLCGTVATNSKCLSRQIGAIIIRDKSIISMGYNGPPRGVPECSERYRLDSMYIKELTEKCPKVYTGKQLEEICPRRILGYKSGEGLDLCIAGHAERNALINAARNGIAVKDAIIYMNCPIPCKDCLIEIINAGIKEIVCTSMDYYDEASKYIVEQSNISIRNFIGEYK